MVKIGIVGGTGYTGVELLRLLASHPQADVRAITSRGEAGTRVVDMFPSLRGHYDALLFTAPDTTDLTSCDVVFFATPHGVAMAQSPKLVAAGLKVIDLAADFRIKDPALFEKWYKLPHTCPDLLAESVYGLPEFHRDEIRKARVVGNPGVSTSPSYLFYQGQPVVSTLCIQESGTGFLAWHSDAWVAGFARPHFYALPYAISASGWHAAVDHAFAEHCGFVYVTDDTLPNPWDTLPAYFESMLGYIESTY